MNLLDQKRVSQGSAMVSSSSVPIFPSLNKTGRHVVAHLTCHKLVQATENLFVQYYSWGKQVYVMCPTLVSSIGGGMCAGYNWPVEQLVAAFVLGALPSLPAAAATVGVDNISFSMYNTLHYLAGLLPSPSHHWQANSTSDPYNAPDHAHTCKTPQSRQLSNENWRYSFCGRSKIVEEGWGLRVHLSHTCAGLAALLFG